MRTLVSGIILGAVVLAIALLAWVDPASAFCFPAAACKAGPQPAPGPLIGFGLPLAGAAVVALMVVRHFRHKE
jgi:hypothetical protein